jgi:ribose transport system substrate-binding protein
VKLIAKGRKVTDKYKLESVSRACELLRQFTVDHPVWSLTELTAVSGLERTICFRLLKTLEAEGLLRKADGRKYASNLHLQAGKKFRIGYASQTHDSFADAVSQGIRWAATESEIDLVEFDNHYSAVTAIRNAEALAKRGIDLVVEFQTYHSAADRISQIFRAAGIPMIAVEIPHPGATFFGVDNHQVGVMAGKLLLKAVKDKWRGECDAVMLLDLGIAGALPSLRLAGVEATLREGLSGQYQVSHLETRGQYVSAFEVTRKYLRFAPKRRTILTGVNDPAVLGALRAFEEAGWGNHCIAISVGGTREARHELRLPNTRLFGSIAFFPERYGAGILRLALDLLHKKEMPSAIYVPTQLITAHNVDQFYPQDIFENEK